MPPAPARRGASVCAAVVLAMGFQGCASRPAVADVVLYLEVDARTASCVGEMAQRCLRVRTPGEAPWRLFYDPIEGFTHQAGARSVIKVARTRRSPVPADASMYRYRLLEVVHRGTNDTVAPIPPPDTASMSR